MKVALIGCGLIGGSIGLALKASEQDLEVIAWDKDPDVADRAVERGAADAAAPTLEAAMEDTDIGFVAIPVRSIAETVAAAARAAKPGCLLTDVGSTKSRLVLEIEDTLPPAIDFIGGHPMSGSEDEGIEAASADLFRGAWWILTPTARADADAYRRLHGLVATLGARVMALDPLEHDRLMAVVSHVPQLTATSLMNMAAERGREHGGLLALAAGGFRDVTRVAASSPDVWLDICLENHAAIADELERFAERLLEVRDLLQQDDEAGMRALLEAARDARRSLPEKAVAGDIHEVRFPVPDRPGVLSEVTTTVGNLGINIEDLRIDHVAEGGRGTLHLIIVGAREAARVAESLGGRGYECRVTER